MKATSRGAILASTRSESSSGTISASSKPGWATAPIVVTPSRLTMPRTGAFTEVRATRSSAERKVSSTTARSASRLASSSWASDVVRLWA